MARFLVLMLLCLTSVDALTEQCQQEGDVRIESTSNGRVDFCQGGVWGAICLDSASLPWSEKNALVVCKQLGFSIALNPVLPNEALAPAEGTPYHLGSVQCLGNETRLDQCTLSNITQCASDRAAGVACRRRVTYPYDVRLVGSPTNGMGAVEIYATVLNWFSVCPDLSVWNTTLANAVCVQLGYESGEAKNFTLAANSVATRRVIKENCTGSFTLPECFTDAGLLDSMTASCSAASGLFAGVQCTSSSLAAGSVRLFGVSGVNDTEGRVEVLYNGTWGTVCRDAFWGRNSGETVCRQLGFSIERVGQVDVSPSGDYAGPSNNRPVWLGRLQCDSNDNMLGSCSRLDTALGSVALCNDHSLNIDAAVNCNTTATNTTNPANKGLSVIQNAIFIVFSTILCVIVVDWN